MQKIPAKFQKEIWTAGKDRGLGGVGVGEGFIQ